MKRLLCLSLILLGGLSSLGCGNGAAWNELKCRDAIVQRYNTQEIAPVPGKRWRYIVRDSQGQVWYVETLSTRTPDVTSEILIFGKR